MTHFEQGKLTIIGGGLAGSEAAWQAAQRGIHVKLYEMRPALGTGAHISDKLAELVCSNSLGSSLPDRASGVLKAELRRLGSLLLEIAEQTALPAGAALAVDRERFAETVTARLGAHPNIEIIRQELPAIPETPAIIASGPLTSARLSQEIARFSGQEHLYFFDAIAPIVEAASIDMTIAYRASRWGENNQEDGDYINCPFHSRADYLAFVEELRTAGRIQLKEFELPSKTESAPETTTSSKAACLSKSSPSAETKPSPMGRCAPSASPTRAYPGRLTQLSSFVRTTWPETSTTWSAFKPT